MNRNRQWILDHRPDKVIAPEIFRWREDAMPSLTRGNVLVRTRMISVSAANRAWILGVTWREQVPVGAVMPAFTVGEVIESDDPQFRAGDIVEGMNGWQDFAVVAPASLTLRDASQSLVDLASLYGTSGLAAYHGFFDIGRPVEGETVLVSAAAGAVGSIVGQFAKISGCRVVGVAGGADKRAHLIEDLGFDAAVDYKASGFKQALDAACPAGVDIYFDNVGGLVLDEALLRMNLRGRIICCGAASVHGPDSAQKGPSSVPAVLFRKRLRMEGFIVSDYAAQRPETERKLAAWAREGRLKVRVDLVKGLDQAPRALMRLLEGRNLGKVVVEI